MWTNDSLETPFGVSFFVETLISLIFRTRIDTVFGDFSLSFRMTLNNGNEVTLRVESLGLNGPFPSTLIR